MTRRRRYNPGQLSAEELKRSFVARGESLDEMLGILREQQSGRPCQHLLLVGARGMGKTTLGLRFLQAVGESPDLAATWQPVPFDEESYGVTSLGDFWLAALRHLGRATGETRWGDRADELDRKEPDPGRRESYALASLLDYCAGGARVILFVENLDLLFAQIGDEREMHALRSALTGHPELLVVGSTNAVFDEIREQDAPFYEFFLRITLSGLEPAACRAVFERILEREGRAAADLVSTEEGRIETIRALTGGNPRLLALAAELLVESPLGSAFEDIEQLIDEQTPYFKALIEALPVQARKVFHYLAGEWTPLRARDVAAGVNLSASHISAQLRQLMDRNYVREVRVAGEARARYEVADRFYNIYYLLRFSRPGRDRLERFVAFLHDLYGDRGMHALYASVLRSIREQAMPETEFGDWVHVFWQHVARDREFGERKAWFEGVLKAVVERLGAEASVLDELDESAPVTAESVYLDSAREAVRAGHYAEAEAVLARLARGRPAIRRGPLTLIGIVQAMAGKAEEALTSFEEAIATPSPADDHGRTLKSTALLSIARLRRSRGEQDAAFGAARRGWNLVRRTDADGTRRGAARELRAVAAGLWETGRREDALGLWTSVARAASSADAEAVRGEAAWALVQAGYAFLDVGEHERSRGLLDEMDGLVDSDDGPALRAVRIRGLACQGASYWACAQPARALAVWRSAPEFVKVDDDVEVLEAAAICLGAAGVGLVERWEDAEDFPSESIECARQAVEYAPRSVVALTVLAQVLAYDGAWSEAMAVLGRALPHLKQSGEARRMLGTLLLVAGEGHLAEVRAFMADTRLQGDLEALWFALELELGRDAGPLPAEIAEAVGRMREIIRPVR